MGGEPTTVAESMPTTATTTAPMASSNAVAATPSSDATSTSPKTSPSSTPKRSPRQQEPYYWVKHTTFLQRNVSYICQNINGPCPLLAICNVLLLRGHVSIDAVLHTSGTSSYIFARDVVHIVENRLLHTNRNFNEAERVLLNEVVALLQTLQVGLDVNVQFHDICAFEYTNACAIFDLLDMRLVHGWVVDPQDTVAYSLLAHKSYNQVVDQLIDYHSMCAAPKEQTLPTLMKERSLSMDDAALKLNQIAANGPVIDAFLADSATQLTYVGLIRLHEHMKERELAVFFRNNHFATVFKMEGALYLLVTDTGYFDEPHVIWEKLEQIDGDSEYYTMTFAPVVGDTTKQKELLQPPSSGTVHDEAPLVAPVPAPRPAVPSRDSPSIAAAATLADDYALALKLQQEEDEADALFVRHAKRPSPQGTTKNSPTGMAAPPLRPSSPARQSEAVTSIVRPQQPPPLRPGGSNDPSLLILTAEELQMQADAERHYNQQRRMQLGQPPSAGAPSRRQSGVAGTADNCSVM